MKKEYDFSKGKRGPIIPSKGKTRITIYIDNGILKGFRDIAEEKGQGYQTVINEVLKEYINKPKNEITEDVLRKIIREELNKAA